MKRKIIQIDEDVCNGCGDCIPNCPEGALQIIDGKARLVSDLMCDGLGACLGHCPVGAITIEEREAEEYDERKVMANIVKQGRATIRAHLEHLREHGQEDYLREAVAYLRENNFEVPLEQNEGSMDMHHHQGCPGAASRVINQPETAAAAVTEGKRLSELRQWPVQLHLVSPLAPYFRGADVVLAADCVAYALGDFHKDWLKGRALAIACPKLDEGQEVYVEKLKALIDDAKINTLTVMIMQVPCCSGLLHTAEEAASRAQRKVPIKCVVVGLEGNILEESWV